MHTLSRRSLLGLLVLPAACTIEPLAPLRRQAIATPQGAGLAVLRAPALGQRWTYQKFNTYNSVRVATELDEVVAVGAQTVIRRRNGETPLHDEVHAAWGQQVRDPAWDYVQNYAPALPLWPADLRVGASESWQTQYTLDNNSFRFWLTASSQVMGWETVSLASGEFTALRIERYIRLQHSDVTRLQTIRHDTLWLVPSIGRWVAREISGEYRVAGLRGPALREDSFRWELQSWR